MTTPYLFNRLRNDFQVVILSSLNTEHGEVCVGNLPTECSRARLVLLALAPKDACGYFVTFRVLHRMPYCFETRPFNVERKG